MNSGIRCLLLMTAILIVTTIGSFAQVQFIVKLKFTGVGPADKDSLWLGVSPDYTDCPDVTPEYGPWREYLNPPAPPGGWDFHAYFINCSLGLYPRDIRSYTDPFKIDTFEIRVAGNSVENGPVIISWSCNIDEYGTSWSLLKKIGPSWTYVANMVTSVSYTDNNYEYSSLLSYRIIKAGSFVPTPPPPVNLNFGDVQIGENSTQSISAYNSGSVNPLIIIDVASPLGYSVTPNPPAAYPITILSGASVDFDVTFSPTSVGTYSGNIVFTTNEVVEETYVGVSGDGVNTLTSFSVGSGWNVVSVPRVQSDYDANAVFPGKNGSMYSYNTSTGAYDAAPTLTNGAGYWVNYSGATTIAIIGDVSSSPGTTAEQSGWVLVGSRETPVAVSSLVLDNGAVINGSAYRYDPVSQSYESTPTIEPGEGVWINVSAACTITIP